MTPMFFRASNMSPDPAYPLTDLGHEYVPEVAEVWIGPLARRLGVAGQQATAEQRQNIALGMTPDGRTQLVPAPEEGIYRPTHGGNYFISKELNAWIASQDGPTRKEAEWLVLEAANETTQAHLLPAFYVRRGKDGREQLPAEVMAVVDKHVKGGGSRPDYVLHVCLSVPSVGRGPDKRYQPIDNYPVFEGQEVLSLGFAGRVIGKFSRRFGLHLSPELGVKGMEVLRDAKTRRAEEIERYMAERGLPDTPAVREKAAQATHQPRDLRVTLQQLIANTREWARSNGAHALRAVVTKYQRLSELREQSNADGAFKRAANVVERLGHPVSFSTLQRLALREAVGRADVTRVEKLVDRVREKGSAGRLVQLPDGTVTTKRIEASRQKTDRVIAKLAKAGGAPPTRQAFHYLAVGPNGPAVNQEQAALAMDRRGVRLSEPTNALGVLVRAYQYDGRRVFVVASERTQREFTDKVGMRPGLPEELARRLDKRPVSKGIAAARTNRLGPVTKGIKLYIQGRRPELALEKGDVLVIDARHANQHAVLAIAQRARTAGATVIHIADAQPPEQEKTRQRVPGR